MNYPEFEYEFTVLESHLDTFGHVNNATYLTLFEQARWELIESRNFGLKQIQKLQVGPTILEINIKYRRELRLREKITIKTRLKELRGKTCLLEQHMFNADGKVCCDFELICGLFDMKTRRLISPTNEWLHAIGANT